MVIGLDDDTWQPSGIVVNDQLLTRLSEFRTDGRILPPPVMAVVMASYMGARIAYLRVHPSDSPPVRLDGKVYVRVGPTTRRATPEDGPSTCDPSPTRRSRTWTCISSRPPISRPP